MDNDLISILIAAYNHQDYIKETIYSCINQTYKNLELIVIDDGSSDNTYSELCKLKHICEKRFIRTIFKTQHNVGILETSHRLKKIMKGKYHYALSSDDKIADDGAIEFLYTFLKNNPDYGLVTGSQDYIDEHSNIIPDNLLPKGAGQSIRRDPPYMSQLLTNVYKDLIKGRSDVSKVDFVKYSDLWFANSIPNGYLISEYWFDKIIPFNVNMCNIEDLYMHYQLTKICKIKVFNKILFHYRIHKSNYANSNMLKNIIETRGLRFFEFYLLENAYTDFFDKDCLKAPIFITLKKEWDRCKKSKFWDEKYYVRKNKEIIDKGWIPLVHYLSCGVAEGLAPCKFFEHVDIKKGVNPILLIKKPTKTYYYLLIYLILKNKLYLIWPLNHLLSWTKKKLVRKGIIEANNDTQREGI